jgi:DNA-binding NarL/FixJ family response regulator
VTYRVLVVDDYERWRRHIGSVVQSDPRWTIVGEAADGAEAVEKAQALKPDLILLDVGLPTIDGIETARRILSVDGRPKIIFLSEHRARAIVDTALGTDACGYVVKSLVARDLLPAMEAAIDGRPFVSAGIAEPAITNTPHGQVNQRNRQHEVGFYSEEAWLLDGYAQFAGSALEAGNAAIFFANGARLDEMHQRLLARGLEVDRLVRAGTYLPLNVADVLATFMTQGRLDGGQFWNAATALVMKAASAIPDHLHVVACGDCSSTLLSQGREEEALRLEHLWHELVRSSNVDVFCGYSTTAPYYDADSPVLQRICAVHSKVHSR